MMLSTLGEEITEKEYMRLVTRHSFGTFSTDLAIPILSKGLHITAYTWNLSVFAHLNLSVGAEIKEKDLKHGLETPSTRMIAESTVNYLRVGGKLYWHPPTLNLIRSVVEEGPALVSVNTATLGDYWRKWDNGHFLILSEAGEKQTLVHDPYYDEKQGSYWVENERLIPAITVNAIRSTDFCMVLTPGSLRSTKNN